VTDTEAQSLTFCVVGAGAVGGQIGARLAASGQQTSALARGATLAALRDHGWRLQTTDGLVQGPVRASADATELGPHDVVVLAVKGPSLQSVAAHLPALIRPGTVVVTAVNGVPWWFFQRFGGRYEGLPLRSVDPGGVLARTIPVTQVLGAVVHFSASCPTPGVVVAHAGRRLIIGEPDGRLSERLQRVSNALRGGGLDVEVTDAVQREIWFKLWGNMTMNPISALTGATADLILDDELVRSFSEAVMREAAAVGAEIGCRIEQSTADRIAVTRQLGALRTSMLQDAEAGRPLELDAMLSAVREIATATGTATPFTDGLLGLSRLNARVRRLYPWESAPS
jgi:2-dehydropantoate 2-reductase